LSEIKASVDDEIALLVKQVKIERVGKAESDKVLDKLKNEFIFVKDLQSNMVESSRLMETKIQKLNSANEILKNYNDLPDLVNDMQTEIDQLKVKL
jgi:hypothetical protein